MKKFLKNVISILPTKTQDIIIIIFQKLKQFMFSKQSNKWVRSGNYILEAPKSHPINDLTDNQPYRDLCIGIASKYIGEKYPSGTFLDIGANIGDTAAIMSTYSQNDIFVIEPSKIYYDLLLKNIKKIKSVKRHEQVFISDGSNITGVLSHWGGTATFKSVMTENVIPTKRIEDIALKNTRFVKIDTDGFDFKIIRDSLNWFKKNTPTLLFENQLAYEKDLNESNSILNSLHNMGYIYFLVFDDAGYLMISTSDINNIYQLNSYLLKIVQNPSTRGISYFDILAIHNCDEDVWRLITEWYIAN